MIKTFKLILGVVWLFTFTMANAQQASTETIKGSPYLNEEFVEGVITYANKCLTVPMRYNAYRDLIEYKQNGQTMELDASLIIKKIKFGNSTFVAEKYQSNGKSKLGYFELLDSGSVMLYAKKTVAFVPGKKGGALDGSDDPARFKPPVSTFYFKIGDGALMEVENLKSMIAALPDRQDELTQFAKKEKISHRNEKEMIRLVQYYNSLRG
ncbi:MAG TPA: hypothetical protein VFW11_25020 [Cyclobacteriaceae bacterium]|nr:hypothetical protein [Cyclobacteriaceae bacterium]